MRRLAIVGSLLCSFLTIGSRDAWAGAREDRVQLYIQISNALAPVVHSHQGRYNDATEGLNETNPCTQEHAIEIIVGDDYSGIVNELAAKLAHRPAFPEDRLALQMITAFRAESAAWTAAAEYYGHHRYQTDQCAKGAEIHRTLRTAWSDFATGEAPLVQFITAFSHEHRASELQAVQHTHGNNFRYYQMAIMNQFEELEDVLTAPALDMAGVGRILGVIKQLYGEILPRYNNAPSATHDKLYQGGYERFLHEVSSVVDLWHRYETERDASANEAEPLDFAARFRNMVQIIPHVITTSNVVRYSRNVH